MTVEMNNHSKDFETALIRCRNLEERWRQSNQGPQASVSHRILRYGVARGRRALRFYGWLADTVLSRVQTISNIAEFASVCDGVDIVSFDVFDTLLYRTVEPPDFLKRRSANFAAQILSRRSFPINRDLFLFVRAEEEMRLRRKAVQNGFDSECKLSEIVYETVKSLCGTRVADAETQRLVQYEVEIECQHLRSADGVTEMLQTLHSRDKRVIATSDTYLEKEHLEIIFKTLGIDQYLDAIYVSSDHGAGKYSGRLFQTVLQREGIRPDRIIHVGDNYESDIRGAIRAGLQAVFLRDALRLRRRERSAHRTAALLAGREPALLNSVKLPTSGNHRQFTDDVSRKLYRIGHDVLGPAFSLFVLSALEECHRWGVEDIYYLAREGHLFREVHDLLVENIYRFRRMPQIPVHYLYVSRLATSLPSVRNFDQRQLELVLYRNPDAELPDMLQTFGLNITDVADLVRTFDSNHPHSVRRLFADPNFTETFYILARDARLRLRRYLAQENFFEPSKTKALMDIGWSATIQANLTRAFYDDPDFPPTLGLYFGRRYTHEDDYSLSTRSIFMPGIVFDERRPVKAEHAVNRCVEIFEIAASAPHGATLGYQEINGLIKPILHHWPNALSLEQASLQAGILDYTARFAKTYDEYELDVALLLKQAAHKLYRFISRPTRDEVNAVKGIQHSVDWGSKGHRPLIATDISPWSIFSPEHLLTTLRHCCWPEGTLRLSGIPGALSLLSLSRQAVRSRQNLTRITRFCLNFFRGRPGRNGQAMPLVTHKNKLASNIEKE